MELDDIRNEFQAEVADLLQTTEDILLSNQQQLDADAVNAVFRAVHTIKGNAGIFQCRNMERFAHRFEAYIEKLREKGHAGQDERDLMLKGRDHLSSLAYYDLDQQTDIPAELKKEEELLIESLESGQSDTKTEAESKRLNDDESSFAVPGDNSIAGSLYSITLIPGKDTYRYGFDPHNFITFLEELGTIESIQTLLHSLPVLSKLEPESAYLHYEILLNSTAPAAEVEDVFEFLKQEGTILIRPPGAAFSLLRQHVSEIVQSYPLSAQDLYSTWQSTGYITTQESINLRSTEDSVAEKPQNATEEPALQTTENRSPPKKASGSIRVDTDRIDGLIDLIGELVIQSQSLRQLAGDFNSDTVKSAIDSLEYLIEGVRERGMGLRMVEVSTVFQRMNRIVYDAGQQLNKKVELKIKGEETELDRSVTEQIQDPLVHLIRNAIDHGIESPAERKAAGKPETAVIELEAYQEMGFVVIRVSDDGAGLNREKIRKRALARELISENAVLSDHEYHQLIFEPGFSTKSEVSELSGRGVGMDVVRSNIESLGGSVDLHSKEGAGTTITMHLPLTLAIIDGFLARAGGIHFVLPLDGILECSDLESHEQITKAGRFVDLRGELVPYLKLTELFKLDKQNDNKKEKIILIRNRESKLGIVVDELHGEFQAVVKPPGKILSRVPGIGGLTILGNGQIAYILDTQGLVTKSKEEVIAV